MSDARFFTNLSHYGSRVAVIEDDKVTTYVELEEHSREFYRQFSEQRKLIFIKAKNNLATLIAYLGALQGNHLAMLLPADIEQNSLDQLIGQFQPFCVVQDLDVHFTGYQSLTIEDEAVLLLSTSGSTGTSKQVALSAENLQSNTESILSFLPIAQTDTTITTLPFYYTYGLSVINTHLQAGASIVFNQYSMISREFWELMADKKVTSFAGVPYNYEILLRLRFTQMSLPNLRYFTQAGGKLNARVATLLSEFAINNSKQFFMMYGQVEATARMAHIDTHNIILKPDSIGKAIAGGTFRILDDMGNPITVPHMPGELCYSGPNCMLGYVESKDDLACLTKPQELHTGDIAYFDEQGDYFICGRKKRFIKLQGHRINLDDIENWLIGEGVQCIVVGTDQYLQVLLCNEAQLGDMKSVLNERYHIHPSQIQIVSRASLPQTHSGKKDYTGAQKVFEEL